MVVMNSISRHMHLIVIIGSVFIAVLGNDTVLAKDIDQAGSSAYRVWPRWLQDFARRIVINAKTISEDDVRYIVVSSQRNAKDEESLLGQVKCVAAMLQRVPYHEKTPELLATAFTKARYDYPVDIEKVRQALKEDKVVAEAVSETYANIVAKKGQVTLTAITATTPDLFVALLKDQRVTAEIYKTVVENNDVTGVDAIDALMLFQGKDDYALALASLYFTDPINQEEAVRLLGVVPYLTEDNAYKLLKLIPAKKPVRYESGQPVYETSSNDVWGMALIQARSWGKLLPLYKAYRSIKTEEDVVRVVAELPDDPQLCDDIGWSVYRYHPKTSLILWKKYQSLDTVAVYFEKYKTTLLSFLKHCRMCPESNDTCKELAEAIRNRVSASKDSVAVVNGLFLLEAIVNEGDLEQLKKLARDNRTLCWNAGTISAPLVAVRAVMCIAAIHSDGSRSILRGISEDKAIDERVRRLAEDMYKQEQH